MNLEQIQWTPSLVEEWLKIAAMVDKSLPPVRMPKVSGQKWDIIREWYELMWDDDTADIKPTFQPTNEQVSMWEEVALRWFKLIDSDTDKKIVWMRACGMTYKKINRKVGLSRQTLTKRYQNTIDTLAVSLNHFYHKIG